MDGQNQPQPVGGHSKFSVGRASVLAIASMVASATRTIDFMFGSISSIQISPHHQANEKLTFNV